MSVALIFLAGGKGERLSSSLPKQFLPLKEKLLFLYSLELFFEIDAIQEIVVVCAQEYQPLFPKKPFIRFALPGLRRQDSLKNGLEQVFTEPEFICIHDAARPFIEKKDVLLLLQEAKKYQAVALATPITSTVKECSSDGGVQKTLDRNRLWEIQTPQIIKKTLLQEALQEDAEEVTDDLALLEKKGYPTHIVPGSKKNFKITTPFDWFLAEKIL